MFKKIVIPDTCKIPKLFNLMNEREITDKDLSVAIGASTGNVSDWKSGRSTPAAEKLFVLAKYFDVSIDYLLDLDDRPNRKSEMPEDIQELLNLYDEITPRQQGEVIGYIKRIVEENSAKLVSSALIKNNAKEV